MPEGPFMCNECFRKFYSENFICWPAREMGVVKVGTVDLLAYRIE